MYSRLRRSFNGAPGADTTSLSDQMTDQSEMSKILCNGLRRLDHKPSISSSGCACLFSASVGVSFGFHAWKDPPSELDEPEYFC